MWCAARRRRAHVALLIAVPSALSLSEVIAAVAVVFILIAASTLTLFAIFGNLMKYLGADPATLEKNRG